MDSSLSEFYGGTLVHYIGPLLDLPLSPRISPLKYSNNGQSLADISHADCPFDFIVNITSTDNANDDAYLLLIHDIRVGLS